MPLKKVSKVSVCSDEIRCGKFFKFVLSVFNYVLDLHSMFCSSNLYFLIETDPLNFDFQGLVYLVTRRRYRKSQLATTQR